MLWPPEVLVLHHPVWSTLKSRVRFINDTCPPKHFAPTILSFFNIWVYHVHTFMRDLYIHLMDGLHLSSSLRLTVCASEPESGPTVSILVHEARRIWIQWDELPVDQQRGFIINYTIYLQTLESSNTELKGEQLHCVLLCVFVLIMWIQLKQWIDSSITWSTENQLEGIW